MPIKLDQKTAIITGASSGIGRATALLLTESGVQVALVSRNSGKRWRSLCVST
jgi:NAD(P)-dependent dehydrogenase (short-subunit alcohol dehydrogenase family)